MRAAALQLHCTQAPSRRLAACCLKLANRACASAPCRHRALPLVSRRCRQLLCSPQLLHSVDVTVKGLDQQAMARLRSLARFLLKHCAGRERQLRLDLGYCSVEQSAEECMLLAGSAATACSGLRELDFTCAPTVVLSSWLLPLGAQRQSAAPAHWRGHIHSSGGLSRVHDSPARPGASSAWRGSRDLRRPLPASHPDPPGARLSSDEQHAATGGQNEPASVQYSFMAPALLPPRAAERSCIQVTCASCTVAVSTLQCNSLTWPLASFSADWHAAQPIPSAPPAPLP